MSCCARVAELADALDLGSSTLGCRGSNPLSRTSNNMISSYGWRPMTPSPKKRWGFLSDAWNKGERNGDLETGDLCLWSFSGRSSH